MAVTAKRRPVRRRPSQRRRWFFGIAVIALAGLSLGGYYWWQRTSAQASPAANSPQTITVTPTSYRMGVSGPGTLEAYRSFETLTSVSGNVQSVVEVGERVSAGQILATLDPAPFERALREAQLSYANAQTQLESVRAGHADNSNSLQESIANAERSVQEAQRELASAESALALARQLHEIGGESAEAVRAAQNTYDQALSTLQSAQTSLNTLRESRTLRGTTNAQEIRNAELSIEQARLNLETAEENLASITFIAPFDGVVESVKVQERGHVVAEASILTLIDDRQLKLIAQIDETEISQVRVGQPAEITVSALSGRTFEGTVTALAPTGRIEQNIPIFDVTVTVDNAELELRPGMTAEAEITVREVENTITLPSAAVQTGRDQSFVAVQQADGSFAPHPAQVIDTIGLNTIVQVDLPPDSVVLVPEGGAVRAMPGGQGPQGRQGPQGPVFMGPGGAPR